MVRFELSRTKSLPDARQTRADDSIEIRQLCRRPAVSVVVVVVVVVDRRQQQQRLLLLLLAFDIRWKSSKTFRERVHPRPTFFER